MPSSALVVKNLTTTFVNNSTPKANQSDRGNFALRNDSGRHCYGFMLFALPAKKGVDYTKALLDIFPTAAIPGTKTIQVQAVQGTWKLNKIVWSNMPTTFGTAISVTKVNAAKNQPWTFDIQPILDAASKSTATFFGLRFRFTTAEATARYFYNHKGSAAYVPRLTVDWSDAPEQPEELVPRDGQAVSIAKPYVQSNFVDLSGNTTLAAVQVQVHTASIWSVPLFDSGEVLSNTPGLDLATTAFPGIAVGQTMYWRTRLKDGANIWSTWSDIEQFTRINKGTITILSPAAGIVEEPTPPFVWSSSFVQEAYQVLIWDMDEGVMIGNSGRWSSDDQQWTANWLISWSSGFRVLEEGVNYSAEIRLWDDENRANTPGDPAYIVLNVPFVYNPSSIIETPVLTSVANSVSGMPEVKLSFSRSTAPDYFTIWRDGAIAYDNLTPGDLAVGVGTYEFVDKNVSMRTEHKWRVSAKVNGAQSLKSNEIVMTPKNKTAWLMSKDGRFAIPLTDYENGLDLTESSMEFKPLNSPEGITVFQGIGGWSGTFGGRISSAVGGKTSRAFLDQFLAIRRETGLPVVLSFADIKIAGTISQMTYRHQVRTEEVMYSVAFRFTENRYAGQLSPL